MREIFVFGGPAGDARAAARVRRRAAITTLCLTPLCAPEQLPDLIDGLAP